MQSESGELDEAQLRKATGDALKAGIKSYDGLANAIQAAIYRDDNYGWGCGVADDVLVGEAGCAFLASSELPDLTIKIGSL